MASLPTSLPVSAVAVEARVDVSGSLITVWKLGTTNKHVLVKITAINIKLQINLTTFHRSRNWLLSGLSQIRTSFCSSYIVHSSSGRRIIN
jgi:hypothetical protein